MVEIEEVIMGVSKDRSIDVDRVRIVEINDDGLGVEEI
jgi:hypothetical protein